MSPGELGLILGIGLVGLFATLVLIVIVAAPLCGRREREWELFAALETDFQARIGSPDPRDEWARDDEFRVRAAVDTGVCAEAENHLREVASRESS